MSIIFMDFICSKWKIHATKAHTLLVNTTIHYHDSDMLYETNTFINITSFAPNERLNEWTNTPMQCESMKLIGHGSAPMLNGMNTLCGCYFDNEAKMNTAEYRFNQILSFKLLSVMPFKMCSMGLRMRITKIAFLKIEQQTDALNHE